MKLIKDAQEELVKEYENSHKTKRGIEPPSTRGMEEADGEQSSLEEQDKEIGNLMNGELDKHSSSEKTLPRKMMRKMEPLKISLY